MTFRKRAAWLVVLLVLPAALSRGEIQTLFRGNCFTPAEGAANLAKYAAAYDSGEEWRARAAAIRQGVLRGLRLETLPPPCELKPIRHSQRAGDGFTVENVAFESLPGFWVTGNLYLPAGLEGPAPGILCPHGHAPDGRLAEYTQTRCAALARMGCIVFAYDMIGYGDSTQVPHRFSETLRLQAYNGLRAVDFLLSLDNVDGDRLAVTGESGGGTQSFVLTAIDDRIDLSVPVVMVSSYFYGGCVCESGLPIHKNGDHETNNVEIAAAAAPRPQLVISDGGDWTAHVPETEFPYLQRVYQLTGAADRVENAHFAEEGHDYGPSKRKAMYAFVAKHFRLDAKRIQNAGGEFDESFFKPFLRAELTVFDAEHPWPDHAAANADAVLQLLDRRR
jgi:pimeloyl-ACP methyl ester carboxylesterase